MRGRWSTAFALIAALAAPATVRAEDEWAAVVAASRNVEAIVANEEGVGAAEQLAALVALGTPAIPALFALHLGLPLPSSAAVAVHGDPAAGENERDPTPPLATSLTLPALRALPAAAVDDYLVEVAAGSSDLRRSIDVVRVAGELARASSFGVLVRVTSAMGPLLQGHPVVAGTLRQAVQAILARDRTAPAALPQFLTALPAAFAAPAIAVAGSSLGEARVGLCGSLLGRSAELDRALVTELEQRPPTDSDGARRMATLLCGLAETRATDLRRLVVRALRRCPTLDAAAALCERLEDDDARVRELAYRSLQELASVTLPADPAAWRDWLEDERRWRFEQLPVLEAQLATATVAQAQRTLATLSWKRIHAAELAGVIGPIVEHPRAELRRAACDALGRLATPDCTGWLRVALDDADRGVSSAAQKSLAKMGVDR